MSAYEIPNLRFSGESAAAIARRRFVIIDSAGKVAQAGATATNVIGASSQPNAAAGEVAEIYDGIVIVEAAAAITAGASVQSNADGKAITLVAVTVDATAGGTTTPVPVSLKAGVAMTSAAASGELISIKI